MNISMKKVLILSNLIFHYRKPVFNELSKFYDITVLHSGKKSVDSNDSYNEIIEPAWKIGPFVIQANVLKEVRSHRYDVIIAMFDLHWLKNILALCFRSNLRFLWWGHRYSKYGFINEIRDLLMQKADGSILYTDDEVGKMTARGLDVSKIFVAPNTIAVPNHSNGSMTYKNSFIFVGRARKRKRIDILIRAFSEVLQHIPKDTVINIVGSGPEIDNLIALAESLGVSHRVVFQGEIIDPEKLRLHFQCAYAYISPKDVGLGVLHSFAYGIPVVTDVSGNHGEEMNNLKDHENALLYKTYDELKEILVTLCNDRSISAKLGQNAYELYEKNRTLQVMVNGFKNAIEGKPQ